jgi:hypothetical protein
VLPFATIGQEVIRGPGDRIDAEGASEVHRLDDDTGIGIKLQLDLNLVAGHHTGGLPVGVA